MPYCDDCDKYWTPNSMNEDGTCPRCGADLEAHTAPVTTAEGATDDDEGVPWHFKLMIVALVVYLGYRFVEIGIKIFT
ncbi:hypothetical protein [Desertimonas flava]|jgi:hypothetical protein|uniref:hypothetical protein n=1 Tax=Desertimonas flava TaxID=2064846 RepID=UPI000E354FDB|nr:hypothetical protein [Desertimonas flava]